MGISSPKILLFFTDLTTRVSHTINDLLKAALFLIFPLFVVSEMNAQHGISLVYAPSKVIKHRSTLLFDVPKQTHEFRIAYTFQTQKRSRWARFWKLPRITINGLFVNFGDEDVLGNAFAVIPELHFQLREWKDIRLNMQFGTGVAYLNKPYHAITNPNNNAIGSNLNNISSLKFGLEYRWNKRWITTLSGGLVHFSNGLSSSPNTGINIYGISVGGVYNFAFPKEELKKPYEDGIQFEYPLNPYTKWVVDVQYQYGFTELTIPGGPKFGVHALSIGGGYRYNEFMTFFLGGEFEHNEATYTFYKRNFYSEQEALDRSRSTIIYIENEFRYGFVFNRLRLGFYLPYPIENSKSMYTKVVTGVYLPKINEYAHPYIGAVLKVHSAVADYLGIMMGIRFSLKKKPRI